MIVLFIGGQVIGNDTIDLLMPMLNVHESSSLQKDCRDYYALTIKRLALIAFHSLSNFNLHLLSIMVQQCAYQNRLHYDGYGQVKDYNEYIHDLRAPTADVGYVPNAKYLAHIPHQTQFKPI